MCGIVGVFGKFNHSFRRTFEEMFHVDQLRGDDSCGVAIIHKKGVTVVKDVTYPMYLVMDKKYERTFTKHDVLGIIGHNRWATKGSVDAKNAHPHTHKNITMVHNGSLHSCFNLPGKDQFENDSANMAFVIGELGIAKAWPMFNGPAMIVFWDNHTKTLNIIGNEKTKDVLNRPMWFGYTEDKTTILYGSEAWMLRGVAQRNEIDMQKEPLTYPKADHLYTFKWDGKEVKETVTKLPAYSFSSSYTPRRGMGMEAEYDDWGYYPSYNADLDAAKPEEKKEEKPEAQVSIPVLNNVKAKVDELCKKQITEMEFYMNYDDCCTCGRGFVDLFEDSIILDPVEHVAMCGDCLKHGMDSGQNFNKLDLVTVH